MNGRPIVSTLLAIVLGATASAASLDEALERFKAAVIKEAKPGATPPTDGRAAQLAMLLARLQTDIDNRNWRDASGQLNFFGEQEKSPEMLQLIHELRLEVVKQTEAGENAIISQFEAAIKEASQVCSSARDPSEIDDTFRALSALRAPNDFPSERLRLASQKLDGAISFVARWQDSLAKERAGKETEAAGLLQSMLDDRKLNPLVDRSQMLARLEKLRTPASKENDTKAESVEELLRETSSPAQLNHLEEELRRRFGKSDDKRTRAILLRVETLRLAYDDYQGGNFGAAFQRCRNRLPAEVENVSELVRLEQQILVKVLGRYLNDDTPAEPANTWDYLMAAFDRAVAQSDWRRALYALETLRIVSFSNAPAPPWMAADIAGFSSLIAAMNTEAAGLRTEAGQQYEEALASGGQHVPTTWIAERLSGLGGVKPKEQSRTQRPR